MKRFLALLCAFVFLFAGCGTRDNTAADPMELAYDVTGFTTIMLGSEGEGYWDYKLSEEEQKEFQKLLQTQKWTEPGELPPMGFNAVIMAKNSEDFIMFVNVYDEEHTLLLIKNDDRPTESAVYFAPIEVAKDMARFKTKLDEKNIK